MQGRPTKLTAAVQETIVSILTAGHTRTVAATAACISLDTLARWMQKGQAAQTGIYADFCGAIARAEAEAEVRMVTIIQMAGAKDWRAATWWLERRRPVDWKYDDTQVMKVEQALALVNTLVEIVKRNATKYELGNAFLEDVRTDIQAIEEYGPSGMHNSDYKARRTSERASKARSG